jgi:hypothetical protein
MNWYLNNSGAAEGPYDDEVMTEMARGHRVASDSLVWHPGLEAWACVAALAPAWWAAALPENMPGKKAAPAIREVPRATKRQLAAPVAPSEGAEAPKQGGGLLKKLFRFGKKSQ